MINELHCGDNLDIISEIIPDASIDLVYLDPPFKSGKKYTTFNDTWRWTDDALKLFLKLVKESDKRIGSSLQAFRGMLGENDMLAYLVMMTPRLIELHRVLKPTGSLYLHCDPTASHYIKLLLDSVFGIRNFQNEIIWCYKTGGATKRRFGRKHDTIYFYTKSNKYNFNPQKEKSYMMHEYGFKKSDFQKDEKGQYSWVIAKDWWEIPAVGSATSERLGYPTQKPEELLNKIIKASSNEGDIILDPFCGCGTAIAVAKKLGRDYIGIDSSAEAIAICEKRLLEIV